MIDENRLLEEINKLPYVNGNYDKENADTHFINGVQTAYELITDCIKAQPKVNECEPYEFEDLKEGMYVYALSCDDIYRIDDIQDEECIRAYGTGYSGCSILEYAEDEFYPVHIGMR